MSSQPHKVDRTGPLAWMATNTIAANLLMVILLGGGLWTAFTIQKEVFPQFRLDTVEVTVEYPGAAPAEVEHGVLLPIEEETRSLQHIREVTSEAEEGEGTVIFELAAGADAMKVFQDIDQAIARIDTFPEEIDEPEVMLQVEQRDVMEIGLFGDVSIWTLRQLAERMRDRLLAHPSITQVELSGVPDYVTHVEVPLATLRRHGLTLGQVAERIEQSSRDVPAGAVETKGGEILLRMQERKLWARQFETIAIAEDDSGGILRLGDIATVTDGFEETVFHSQFNRTPSVEMEIFRTGNESPLEIAEAVYAIMDEYRAVLPPGVELRIDSNRARDFADRLSLLLENGGLAILIVLGILAIFLEIRLAFWVMMGMVVSFAGGLLLMPIVGVSVNMVSMFAFIVVLGIVVDDAVVVGENIYSYREKGYSPLDAAIIGVREMATPVTFSILTNLVAFVPLLFLPGTTGKFWWPLPVVVITFLTVSLLEALFVLPAHLTHAAHGAARAKDSDAKSDGDESPRSFRGSLIRQRVGAAFDAFVDRYYRRLLDAALAQRYVALCLALALLLMVGGYGYSDHMGLIMMPEVAADEIEAGVALPVGTTPDQAGAVAKRVTDATHRMFEAHDLYRDAEGIKTNVRGQNFIDVEIVLKPPYERERSVADIITLWRDEIGDIPGVDQITFEAERGPGGWRDDISVDVSHTNIDVLERASTALVARAKEFQTTRDVNDNYNRGKQQLDFTLRPEGELLGLTPENVGTQLRNGFYGAIALRQLRAADETEIRVKLPLQERKDLRYLEDFVIRTPAGLEVPLLDVAQVQSAEAFTTINRRDGRRVVTVGMDVEPKRATGQVLAALDGEVLPALRTDYPGLSWSFEGSQADMRESTAMLWGGFALAMAVIFGLLAVAFNSYVQPLIVMAAIPFGVIGAVLGHILLGYDLSLISLMGLVALSGIVVNDSLILIDHANRVRRRDGLDAFSAIREAGLRRFRPIILTTLTTFGGLTPIILETSAQAAYLIPMAISLGCGILFATAITLVIVPCLYLVLEDVLPKQTVGDTESYSA